MQHEHYFCKYVDEDTWEYFSMYMYKGNLSDFYQRITGYGWKDLFSFNPNGSSLYIDENGYKYKGIWFEMRDKKIAIYKNSSIQL